MKKIQHLFLLGALVTALKKVGPGIHTNVRCTRGALSKFEEVLDRERSGRDR